MPVTIIYCGLCILRFFTDSPSLLRNTWSSPLCPRPNFLDLCLLLMPSCGFSQADILWNRFFLLLFCFVLECPQSSLSQGTFDSQQLNHNFGLEGFRETMHKQYLAATVGSLNEGNVGGLPGWFWTIRIAWVFASRVDNRRGEELYEQCTVPTCELRRNLQVVQGLSQGTRRKSLASGLLIQIPCISKRKHQKNIQEAKLKELHHSGSLSCFFLIQVYFHVAVSGIVRRILPSPHCFPSPLPGCILNQAVLRSSAANLHISGFALSEDNFSCLMRSENEVRHELEKGHSMCSKVY